MKTFHLIFNHTLTERQLAEAEERWGVGIVAEMPPPLRKLWAEIPPETEDIRDYLEPLREYLERAVRPGDVALVQGEPGASCMAAAWIRTLEGLPIYATTRRTVREVRVGERIEKRSLFEHVRFREYR
jgi:hypothetical protein